MTVWHAKYYFYPNCLGAYWKPYFFGDFKSTLQFFTKSISKQKKICGFHWHCFFFPSGTTAWSSQGGQCGFWTLVFGIAANREGAGSTEGASATLSAIVDFIGMYYEHMYGNNQIWILSSTFFRNLKKNFFFSGNFLWSFFSKLPVSFLSLFLDNGLGQYVVDNPVSLRRLLQDTTDLVALNTIFNGYVEQITISGDTYVRKQ